MEEKWKMQNSNSKIMIYKMSWMSIMVFLRTPIYTMIYKGYSMSCFIMSLFSNHIHDLKYTGFCDRCSEFINFCS